MYGANRVSKQPAPHAAHTHPGVPGWVCAGWET